MFFAILIFATVELSFSWAFHKSWSGSFKKITIVSSLPAFIFLMYIIGMFLFRYDIQEKTTLLFYFLTFYMLFFIPKMFFLIFYTIFSIPLLIRKFHFLKLTRKVISSAVLLFFFIYLLLAIFVGSQNIEVIHHKIAVKNLPLAFNHLKIVQLSDLHAGSIPNKITFLHAIVDSCNKQQPDIIVFTGDLVNQYYEEAEGLDTIFNKLQAKLGKFAVLGNHDFGDYSLWKCPNDKERNLTNVIFK